jgi:hypothetical protein
MVRSIVLSHNVIYNGPRAGINQNDGFAGGAEFSYNLMFNTVLDTGDHGNFNSWDRKPFLWLDDDDEKPRMVPRMMAIHHNFIIRTSFQGEWGRRVASVLNLYNYTITSFRLSALGTQPPGPSNNLYCIDHDDGSSMYNDTSNFLVYGGIKFREGISKHASYNYLVYANGPDTREVPFADQCRGTRNSFTNNTVISGTSTFYGSCAKYDFNDQSSHVLMDHNTFYAPNATFNNGKCGGSQINDFSKWQKAGLGQDQNSELKDILAVPSAAMIAAGRSLMGMH